MMRLMMYVLALAVLGCGSGKSAFEPEDEDFVETMVELRRAALATGRDTAAFEERRQEILDARGVTEDSLRTYVARRSADLERMAAIWDSVNARLTVGRVQDIE